jgi:hypothetical protein
MSNKTVYILLCLLLIIHWGLVAYFIGFKP